MKLLLDVNHETMILQVGVKVLIKNKEGKFLLLKRNPEKYPNVKDCWDIPGGRIEPGTSLQENLGRELAEETKMVLHGKPRLVAAQDIIRVPEKHVVRLTYIGDASGEPVLDTTENAEYAWLTIEEMKKMPDVDRYVKELADQGVLHETR